MTRRPSDVPASVVKQLNAGKRETANLAEALAIDLGTLLRAAAPELPAGEIRRMREARSAGYTKCLRLGAEMLLEALGPSSIGRFAAHPSDTVRGWAAYMVGRRAGIRLAGRLKAMRPLADDPHFGVREWAWLGVREHIVADPVGAVGLLTKWTGARSASVRRFASEATRPRGVWCAHIPELRSEPWLALGLLEPLRADPAKYVQDSVANWLNDASKDRPEWVIEVTDRWLGEDVSVATARICKRARRSIDRKA